MGLIEKVGAVALVVSLLGGAAYYAVSRIQAQAETIGSLEAEQRQTKVALEDSEASGEATRAQLEMWQWLYSDLQGGYDEIREDRKQMSDALDRLRREADVEEYLRCPMPDALYDWVRQN